MHFTIDPNIARAETIPSEWYRSSAAFAQALEALFLGSWQFVSENPRSSGMEPLTLLPKTLAEPVILVSDGSTPSILSNVCTHRGNILLRSACPLKEIRCGYHGRRFSSNGKCSYMPEFGGVEGFPSATDHLKQYPLREWEGLLFTCIGRENMLFEEVFADIRRRTGYLELQNCSLRTDLLRSFTVQCHWATYVENYLEGFHIPFVHGGLNAVLDFSLYETHILPWSVLQIGIARENDVVFHLPPNHVDAGKRVAAYYYFVFPNIMINVYPWGISLNIVEPVSTNETIVHYRTYVLRDDLLNTGAGSDLDTVEHEDDEIVESVAKGLQSRAYTRGRYSPLREQGVHAFHRIIARLL